VNAVLEFLWFLVLVAAFVSTIALLLLGAYLALACMVGRWVSTPDDDELDGVGVWDRDDEEVTP
jgi:hypothetical protein